MVHPQGLHAGLFLGVQDGADHFRLGGVFPGVQLRKLFLQVFRLLPQALIRGDLRRDGVHLHSSSSLRMLRQLSTTDLARSSFVFSAFMIFASMVPGATR